MSLRQWLREYPCPLNMSEAQFSAWWKQFKEDLRRYWRERGIEVTW